MLHLLLIALLQNPSAAQPAPDPFVSLMVYSGSWTVKTEHPWSGSAPGTPDHLVSKCQHFTQYLACEQTVNGKTLSPFFQSLLVYTAGTSPGNLHTRFIVPDGQAGARGDLTLDGNHWTYLDKPPAGLPHCESRSNWSRTENFLLDRDHIRFEEFESSDEGKTWTKTNSGTEERTAP